MKIWASKIFDAKTETLWFVTLDNGIVIGPFKTKTAAKLAARNA